MTSKDWGSEGFLDKIFIHVFYYDEPAGGPRGRRAPGAPAAGLPVVRAPAQCNSKTSTHFRGVRSYTEESMDTQTIKQTQSPLS